MIATLVMLAALTIPPRPTGFVTDTAHALSTARAGAINDELQSFKDATGDEVIVWIGATTGGAALEDWTSRVADRWKFGQKGKDNGAILFLFMHDHRVRIEVGYGLEPKLTDAKAAEIVNGKVVPDLKSGNVDDAVRDGVDGMLAAIDPAAAAKLTAPASAAPASGDGDDAGEGIAAIVVLLLILGVIFCIIVTIARRGHKHGDWMDNFLISSEMGSAAGFGGHGFGGAGGGGGFSGGGGGFGGGGASGSW